MWRRRLLGSKEKEVFWIEGTTRRFKAVGTMLQSSVALLPLGAMHGLARFPRRAFNFTLRAC